MKFKILMANILSLVILLELTVKPSYAIDTDMKKIVQQIYGQTSTNYPPKNMSYDMQKIVRLYNSLSKSDKEKFHKIYKKNQKKRN